MADVVVILEQKFVYKDHTEFLAAIRAARLVSNVNSPSGGMYPDKYNEVDTTERNVTSGPEPQSEHENEETAGGDDEDVRHSTTTTNDIVSRADTSREGSSPHARGGGLGRLLRQCFGVRSPSRRVPQYRYHEEHRSRPRPRRRRARHRSHKYSGSRYSRHPPRGRRRHRSYEHGRTQRYRRDRYGSPFSVSNRHDPPPPRRRNEPRQAAPKAKAAPNYDAMNDDELFDTLLAEERDMDPMLRDMDERRAWGEDV